MGLSAIGNVFAQLGSRVVVGSRPAFLAWPVRREFMPGPRRSRQKTAEHREKARDSIAGKKKKSVASLIPNYLCTDNNIYAQGYRICITAVPIQSGSTQPNPGGFGAPPWRYLIDATFLLPPSHNGWGISPNVAPGSGCWRRAEQTRLGAQNPPKTGYAFLKHVVNRSYTHH